MPLFYFSSFCHKEEVKRELEEELEKWKLLYSLVHFLNGQALPKQDGVSSRSPVGVQVPK